MEKKHILQQVNQQLNVIDECKDLKKAYLNLVLVCFEIFVSYFAKTIHLFKNKTIREIQKLTRALTIICCSESRFNIVRFALTLNTNGY